MAKLTVQWWGVQVGLTEAETIYVYNNPGAINIDNESDSPFWWIKLILAIWLLIEREWMKAVDRGNGVYLNISWFAIWWWQWWSIFPTTR